MHLKKEYRNRLISWAVIIVLFIIACFYYKESVTEIIEGIKELNKIKIVIGCLIAVVSFLAEGFIIFRMANHINPEFKWRDGFKISYFCEFFRVLTLGSGAGVAEIFYLQKKKIPVGNGTGIAIMQYGSKKIAILLCGIIGFFTIYFEGNTFDMVRDKAIFMGFGAFFTGFVAIFMMALAFSRKFNKFCKWIIDMLDGKFHKYHKYFDKWETMIDQLNEAGQEIIHQPVVIFQIVVAAMIKFFAIYTIPAIILMGHCEINVFMSTMLVAVVGMVDIIIPIPSGVGSFEFLSVLLFEGVADGTDTLTAILVFRFATWIVPFVVGMILWIIDRIRE